MASVTPNRPLKKLLNSPGLFLLLLTFHASAEEIRIAIIGDFPEGKSMETRAAQYALDAANARDTRRHAKVRLMVLHDQATPEGALDTARKAAEQPQVLGVVVHGEGGAADEVLRIFDQASLAVVVASSWASPRPLSPVATWLSPDAVTLAQIAAVYVRRGKQARQVAIVDNGAPTAQAAARAFAARFKELGGRVDYEGEWQGSEWGLTRTTKALKANWPQAVFFAGEGKDAGLLVKAMRKEGGGLKETSLIGLPALFDPNYFSTAGSDTRLCSVIFPCPAYSRGLRYSKNTGVNFPKGSAADKAYVSYANRPGRWAGMVFDATQLLLDALERAAASDTAGVWATSGDLSTPASAASVPTRLQLRQALLEIDNYKGIRGRVRFNSARSPADPKAMIFYALPSTKKSKNMRWYERQYGPPFME